MCDKKIRVQKMTQAEGNQFSPHPPPEALAAVQLLTAQSSHSSPLALMLAHERGTRWGVAPARAHFLHQCAAPLAQTMPTKPWFSFTTCCGVLHLGSPRRHGRILSFPSNVTREYSHPFLMLQLTREYLISF